MNHSGAMTLREEASHMNRILHILVCLLLTCLLPLHSQAARTSQAAFSPQSSATRRPLAVLNDIKHWSTPDYTRVSIELDQDVAWETHELGKGGVGKQGRIFIDIKRSRLAMGIKNITIGDGLLKGVRVAQYRPEVVRVVLDTQNIKSYKVFPLSTPARLVIDVRGERPTEISRMEQTLSTTSPPVAEPGRSEAAAVTKRTKSPRRVSHSKIRRIVLDPGHGGHDPGAVGAGGTQEKDVVLAIGLKLRELIREELGLDVVMTRTSDVFIPLEERTAIANKVNADLFLSIHANAAPNHAASGIETYYLSLAKTEKAARLAAKENGTTLEKVSVLQAILFDLMANYKLNDSAHLANDVQKALHKKIHGLHADVRNLGVKQGPFYVLVGATMPSILVETAFVSNVEEEARLKDPAYQEATAEGILEGVRAYISSLK